MSHTEILSCRLLPSAVHTVLLSQAVYDIFYMSSSKKHRTVKLGNVQKVQYETVHRLGVYNSCLNEYHIIIQIISLENFAKPLPVITIFSPQLLIPSKNIIGPHEAV